MIGIRLRSRKERDIFKRPGKGPKNPTVSKQPGREPKNHCCMTKQLRRGPEHFKKQPARGRNNLRASEGPQDPQGERSREPQETPESIVRSSSSSPGSLPLGKGFVGADAPSLTHFELPVKRGNLGTLPNRIKLCRSRCCSTREHYSAEASGEGPIA